MHSSEKRLPTQENTKTASADTSYLENSVQQAEFPPETQGMPDSNEQRQNPAQLRDKNIVERP